MGITVSGASLEPRREPQRRAGSCGSSRASTRRHAERSPRTATRWTTGRTTLPPRALAAGTDHCAQARRTGEHHRGERAPGAHGRALARHRARELLRRRAPASPGRPADLRRAIAPGGSFEARFTPPRSGTFIYHTHLDDMRQQQGGTLGGAARVDDPASLRSGARLVMLVTVPRKAADGRGAAQRLDHARRARVARRRALSLPLHQRAHVPAQHAHAPAAGHALLRVAGNRQGRHGPAPRPGRRGPVRGPDGKRRNLRFRVRAAAPGDFKLEITAATSSCSSRCRFACGRTALPPVRPASLSDAGRGADAERRLRPPIRRGR